MLGRQRQEDAWEWVASFSRLVSFRAVSATIFKNKVDELGRLHRGECTLFLRRTQA